MTTSTQLAVIGGGPGGYVAAFRAADLGLDVTLIDLDENPGGVCLYRGCIPSKALLHVAKLLNETKEASEWGVSFGEPEIDLDKLRAYKDRVVAKMTGGLGQLSKARKVTYIRGRARFTSAGSLSIELHDGSTQELAFDHAVLATGSRPIVLPAFDIGSDRVMDSTGALELADIPGRMLIVGGGIIGLELGQVYAALGTKVSVVEMTAGLIPPGDRDLVRILQKRLENQFESIRLETKVTGVAEDGEALKVTMESLSGGDTIEEQYDRILLSIGRRPNSEDLGLENTKVQIDERGFVQSDVQKRTAEPTIFAIGDVIGSAL
ncbi:MAG: dihydrolipoyl dehydrogenase, partial [Gemmatimonadetes bacterium]|nr:dihydrolipoyl dehydrogenase [Gemmatimonadota bacterium]